MMSEWKEYLLEFLRMLPWLEGMRAKEAKNKNIEIQSEVHEGSSQLDLLPSEVLSIVLSHCSLKGLLILSKLDRRCWLLARDTKRYQLALFQAMCGVSFTEQDLCVSTTLLFLKKTIRSNCEGWLSLRNEVKALKSICYGDDSKIGILGQNLRKGNAKWNSGDLEEIRDELLAIPVERLQEGLMILASVSNKVSTMIDQCCAAMTAVNHLRNDRHLVAYVFGDLPSNLIGILLALGATVTHCMEAHMALRPAEFSSRSWLRKASAGLQKLRIFQRHINVQRTALKMMLKYPFEQSSWEFLADEKTWRSQIVIATSAADLPRMGFVISEDNRTFVLKTFWLGVAEVET
eukprot:Colp12_sorted_trinity150504_noHs@25382